MRTLTLILAALSISSVLFSQTPGARWSRSIGGSGNDYGTDIQKTVDGGSLFVGSTWSKNGDVSGNHDSSDLWVVKLNQFGGIEWQRCYGGTGDESFRKLLYNPDGTAILIGVTSSNNNGDITGKPNGSFDIWVIKIDAFGNIIWQNTLGGSSNEEFRYADFTNDNGYIIAGYTSSTDSDVTGNHGGEDIWVVKLSSAGSVEWQKALGGSGSDRPRFITQNSDGNYIMVGSTASSDGNVTGAHGNNDLWVVKLDGSGTLIWQKCYGGTSSDTGFKGVFSSDGSLTVLANTMSVNGDVTGKTSSIDIDTWVLNVDYANGNINWQKTIGGSSNETPVSIMKDADNMFLVASTSNSQDGDGASNHGAQDVLLTRLTTTGNVSWGKCFGGPSDEVVRDVYNDVGSRNFVFVATTCKGGGDVVGYHQNPTFPGDTSFDAWVVKIDYSGTIQWQRCLGGTNVDYLYSVRKVSFNSYVLAGESFSNDGDVQLPHGYYDAWVVEVAPVNTIKGTVFLDNNLNGVKDDNEPLYSEVVVKSRKATDSVSSVPYFGVFTNEVDSGKYETMVTSHLPYYTAVPSSRTSDFTSYFNKDSFSFALQPIPGKQDLSINLVPLTTARPGFAASYQLVYRNLGTTTITSGEILFRKDPRVNLSSASPGISSTNGDTLKWAFANLHPGDASYIRVNVTVSVPPTVNINDTLSFLAIITPVETDQTPLDDSSFLKQRVTGSYDPNDKTENNAGVITSDFITNGSYLQYTVRFQNTGTAEAYNITVRDTLGDRVDLSTLEIISVSHPYSFTIENGNQLVWQFDNVMLPASSVNEPASHGYIVYRIRPKSDVVVGETIHNTASIYFDYNLPVLTNDATTLVKDNFTALPLQLLNFTGQLTNSSVQLNWNLSNAVNFERFEVERSLDGKTYSRLNTVPFTAALSAYSMKDNVSALPSNALFYRLKLVDADGHFSYSKVVVFKINTTTDKLTVYPNPARTELFVSFTADAPTNLNVKIIDASGRAMVNRQTQVQKGNNVFPLPVSQLKAGNYILQVSSMGQTKASKFTVMD
jgi:uncharacterized repeat protein (TIGR01451 family)